MNFTLPTLPAPLGRLHEELCGLDFFIFRFLVLKISFLIGVPTTLVFFAGKYLAELSQLTKIFLAKKEIILLLNYYSIIEL